MLHLLVDSAPDLSDKKGAKKSSVYLQTSTKNRIFAFAKPTNGTVAQLNRASDYGSEGFGFESQRCHS